MATSGALQPLPALSHLDGTNGEEGSPPSSRRKWSPRSRWRKSAAGDKCGLPSPSESGASPIREGTARLQVATGTRHLRGTPWSSVLNLLPRGARSRGDALHERRTRTVVAHEWRRRRCCKARRALSSDEHSHDAGVVGRSVRSHDFRAIAAEQGMQRGRHALASSLLGIALSSSRWLRWKRR